MNYRLEDIASMYDDMESVCRVMTMNDNNVFEIPLIELVKMKGCIGTSDICTERILEKYVNITNYSIPNPVKFKVY